MLLVGRGDMWPGITLLNVWQLSWHDWNFYVRGAKEMMAAREKAARG